jgi:hypothetical protein
MNSITISRSLVGILLVAWLPFVTAAHATDRAASIGSDCFIRYQLTPFVPWQTIQTSSGIFGH